MKTPVSRSPKTDRHSGGGFPVDAGSRHLADLTEWFCGFGFEPGEAEAKAFAWMNEEGTLCLVSQP